VVIVAAVISISFVFLPQNRLRKLLWNVASILVRRLVTIRSEFGEIFDTDAFKL